MMNDNYSYVSPVEAAIYSSKQKTSYSLSDQNSYDGLRAEVNLFSKTDESKAVKEKLDYTIKWIENFAKEYPAPKVGEEDRGPTVSVAIGRWQSYVSQKKTEV